jgi:hypothetical protein
VQQASPQLFPLSGHEYVRVGATSCCPRLNSLEKEDRSWTDTGAIAVPDVGATGRGESAFDGDAEPLFPLLAEA